MKTTRKPLFEMLWHKHSRPAGLKRRVLYAFVLLVSGLTLISALAVKNAFEHAEATVTDFYLSDISNALLRRIEHGDNFELPPTMALYGALEGMTPIPDRWRDLPPGYSEINGSIPILAYRSQWKGSPVVLVRQRDAVEIADRKMWMMALATVVATLVFALIFGAVLWRRILQPVERLSQAVRQTASGTRYAAIPQEIMTHDEVGALARICDDSLGRLYDALERERALTSNLSHELRTPLTVIETSSELLEASELSAQQTRQVSRILKAVGQMRSSLSFLLRLARRERGDTEALSDNVSGVVRLVEETWSAIAAQKHIELTFDSEGDCPGRFSPVLLSTVLNNLVESALCSVAPAGRICVLQTPDGFYVADNGPKIDQDRLKNLLAEASVATGTGTSGGDVVGLAVVGRICARAGWKLSSPTASEMPARLAWADGTVFKITLGAPEFRRRDTLFGASSEH